MAASPADFGGLTSATTIFLGLVFLGTVTSNLTESSKMRSIACLFALLLCFFALSQANKLVGQCKLSPTSYGTPLEVSGWVYFEYDPVTELVVVEANITGAFENGTEYGMHIHEFGDLTDADAALSTGPHYVGGGSSDHGCPPSTERHEGDMGNWTASEEGIVETKTLDLLQLSGPNSIIGRAVILHELPDNCTGTNGYAGNRLAQCVVGITNLDGNVAENDLSPVDSAVCVLQPTPNCQGCGGTVWLKQIYDDDNVPSAVEVTAQVTGLEMDTVHGFHIHQWGDLSVPTATSAGGHWNPFGQNHGLPFDSPRHQGDLGNLQSYDDNGDAWYHYQTTDLTDLNTVIGRSIIVHQTNDHGRGSGCDQTGNAGSRYAVCVIGIANPSTTAPTVPIDVNNNWQNEDCVTPQPPDDGSDDGGDGTDGGDGDDDDNGGLVAAVVIGWILVFLLMIAVVVMGVFLFFTVRKGYGRL